MFKKQILGLLYRFTAHCGVILVLQDSCVINVKFLTRCHRSVIECKGNILTWYDRTVTKREPAAPIPEALSWLHPGYRRYSRLLKIVDQQAVDAEEGGFT